MADDPLWFGATGLLYDVVGTEQPMDVNTDILENTDTPLLSLDNNGFEQMAAYMMNKIMIQGVK